MKVERDHLAALDYKEAKLSFRAAPARRKQRLWARALEFVLLTAARSSEALEATWDEIDFETRTWTIPPARLKTGKKTL